jgi:hypothetical protein
VDHLRFFFEGRPRQESALLCLVFAEDFQLERQHEKLGAPDLGELGQVS